MAIVPTESSHLAWLQIVTPGEDVVVEPGFLTGHGTYVSDGALVSSLAGSLERINRLITVRPPHSRYTGDVGDVVVGRVRTVGNKRWRVDVGARQDAVLMLSSINLEGGALRRRTLEDALNMRSLLSESDLLSAEVHSIQSDGSLALHARSAKYGALSNGVLVTVPPGLIRRSKQHFVSLPAHVGCDLILGLNGFIWITESVEGGSGGGRGEASTSLPAVADGGGGENVGSPLALIVDPLTGKSVSSHAAAPMLMDEDSAAAAGVVEAVERRKAAAAERVIGREGRLRIARVHNAICVLRGLGVCISADTVVDVVNDAVVAGVSAADMAHPRFAEAVTASARQRIAASAAS